ncbi:DUF6197 family protein [Streptomyces malaysiensis]|uniref:Uncharacterized protein n=1 Tax=Streptomyces malaysiensis subsp. samsunensis TaxID=459658 RepID=A0A9X2RV23_STRMQ|nr:hypothetical protein [Streptomyces samsunensis]MCQ8831852.1 hypothetical protein [Streptomyces samsunensis]
MTALIADYAAVYRRAANIIRANGHNKGYWYPMAETEIAPAECPVCAAGAISIALTGSPKPARCDVPLVEAAVRRLMEHLIPGYKRALAIWDLGVLWNDVPERTADDVIAAFEDAARAEETAGVMAA